MAVLDDYAFAVKLQMQLTEEDLRGGSLGKLPQASDTSAAVRAFQEELNGALMCAEDRRIANKLRHAMTTDAPILTALERREQQEANDRAFAARAFLEVEKQEERDRALALKLHQADLESSDDDLAEHDIRTRQPEAQPAAAPYSENVRTPPTSETLFRRSKHQSSAGAAPAVNSGGASSSRNIDCDICMEKRHGADVKGAPCGHTFCTGCFRDYCKAALRDISLIPVNCCKKDFPQDWIKEVLSPDQWLKYTRLQRDVSQAHISRTLDPEYQLSVARAGGKICPKCGKGIDLEDGCNHITCTCKHEFCFVCLKKWQTCQCELYSDEMRRKLLQAARQPQRQQGVPHQQHAQVPQQPQQPQGAAMHVHTWTRVRKGGECDECAWYTPKFIFHCASCDGQVCLRCRNHHG